MYVIKFTFNRNTPDDISAPQIELKCLISVSCRVLKAGKNPDLKN